MVLEVQRYKLEFKYVKGQANVVADALSRGIRVEGETEPLQVFNEAVVNVLVVGKKTKWLEQLEKDEDFLLVLDALRKDGSNRTLRMHGTITGYESQTLLWKTEILKCILKRAS
ncbi:unnamed protein product [Haemonchus placei]|uniref:RT_RNaseH domain-containing protein n=1 Tax=Haemonchus placei TaxID=6290 RepID=A0A0N4X244_HAEPC|nr:unnamed protein product [Haemonchus placei]